MQKHTFLFNPAVWEVAGNLIDQSGSTYPLEGITRVEHKKNLWMNDLMMKVPNGPGVEFYNFVELNPIAEDQQIAQWKSKNPNLGDITGSLFLSGDEMFIDWSADDGKHTGKIHLHMIDKQNYTHDGFVFRGKERLLNWKLHLKRV